MFASVPVVVASTWPQGPAALTCLFLPVLILGPFLLLAVAARSLLGGDPLPAWLVILTLLGGSGLAYLVATAGTPLRGFWQVWQLAGAGALLLLPAVLVREAVKRDWLRRARHRDEET